ncbi:hypothetical protein D3C86_984720 [compost metagenome]
MYWCRACGRLQHGLRRHDQGVFGRQRGRGRPRVHRHDVQPAAGRTVILQMRKHGLDDLRGILAFHDANGQLGLGFAGDDGLRARAAVAAPHAVHVQGRAQGDPFAGRVARLTVRHAAHLREEGGFVVGEGGGVLALARGRRFGAGMETGHGDSAVFAVQGCQQGRHLVQGIPDAAAVSPGVQVFGCGAQLDLQGGMTARARVDRGRGGAGAAAIGRQHGIRGKQVAVAFDQRAQGRAARFLFAFDEHLDVDRAGAQRGQVGEHDFKRNGGRSLDVGRAARIEAVADLRRFEGRGAPQFDGVGGLDVVMAIDQQRRSARRAHPFAIHGRFASPIQQLYLLQAFGPQPFVQEAPGLVHGTGVGGIGADTGNAQEGI